MHTRSTLNYQLPQFNASDKPTWLGDINGAFLAIDGAMHENAQNATEAKSTATSALAALNSALELAQNADTKATSALSTANSASTTATAAAETASAASSSAAATAALVASMRVKPIWTNNAIGSALSPTTETIANYSATGKLFTLVFVDNSTNGNFIEAVKLPGAGNGRGSEVDFDLTNGDIIKAYRDITFADSGDNMTIAIGACNILTSDGSAVTPTVDNTKVILAAVYAEELPTV